MTAFAIPGFWELAIVGGIAVLLFGPSLIRRLCRTAGDTVKAVKELQKGIEEAGEE